MKSNQNNPNMFSVPNGKAMGWTLTDDGSSQYVKAVSHIEYHLVEYSACGRNSDGDYMYEVYTDEICVDGYLAGDKLEELETMILSSFSHGGVANVLMMHGNCAMQIIAECIFEYYGNSEARSLFTGNEEQCREFIEKFIAEDVCGESGDAMEEGTGKERFWNSGAECFVMERSKKVPTTALIFRPANTCTPYIVAMGHKPGATEWDSGSYFETLLDALKAFASWDDEVIGISVDANGRRKMTLTQEVHDGPIKFLTGNDHEEDSHLTISADEIVMLLIYYLNCKSGSEKSDYIIAE